MPDPTNNNNQSPTTNNQMPSDTAFPAVPEDTTPVLKMPTTEANVPSAPPDLPPIIPPTASGKKFAGKKIIATILGLLLLVGGIGAGIVLVRQQQEIREKAKEVECDEFNKCGPGYICKNYKCVPKPTPKSTPTKPPPSPATCASPAQCVNQYSCPSSVGTDLGQRNCGTGYTCCQPKPTPTAGPFCDFDAQDVAPPPDNCAGGLEGNPCKNTSGVPGTCKVVGQTNVYPRTCRCETGAPATPTPRPTPTSKPPTPKPTPTRTPTPTPSPIAQCLDIKAYDTSWNQLTATQLSALRAGDKVRFTVRGSATSGSFDKARFTINGTQRPEVTTKKPNTDEFDDEYTIPTGVTSFSITAQVHHVTLGWK